MAEESQGPPSLCFINYRPGAIDSLARPDQVDLVAETNVHVGSKDEVATDHGDKSNDLIWRHQKRFKCILQACNVIVRV